MDRPCAHATEFATYAHLQKYCTHNPRDIGHVHESDDQCHAPWKDRLMFPMFTLLVTYLIWAWRPVPPIHTRSQGVQQEMHGTSCIETA